VVLGFILVPDIASCICFQAGVWGSEPSVDPHDGFLAAQDGFFSHCLVLVAHILDLEGYLLLSMKEHPGYAHCFLLWTLQAWFYWAVHCFQRTYQPCCHYPLRAFSTSLLASMRDYCGQALGHHNDTSYSPVIACGTSNSTVVL
jgi:hypothetical protein